MIICKYGNGGLFYVCDKWKVVWLDLVRISKKNDGVRYRNVIWCVVIIIFKNNCIYWYLL